MYMIVNGIEHKIRTNKYGKPYIVMHGRGYLIFRFI